MEMYVPKWLHDCNGTQIHTTRDGDGETRSLARVGICAAPAHSHAKGAQ